MARTKKNEDDKKKAGSPYKWVCTGKHSIGVLGRIVHKGESITEAEYKKLPARVKAFFDKAPVQPEPEVPTSNEDPGTGEGESGQNENPQGNLNSGEGEKPNGGSGKGDEDPKGGEGVGGNGDNGNND